MMGLNVFSAVLGLRTTDCSPDQARGKRKVKDRY
jgi:hypothetical protein